ncbi:hypothetical protein [Plastoroseomonas arctica]|uniref:Uncharacterized protein n=1 Tax=Plastoroseomonas arctica TaxID=1509237 RepID=A0AAF1KTN3_9PROT|nr:hypothetical protein [Plastoroseomonas arctica]MBR0655182.1 hypothetical protein [Plastoroseomonas arctica]
MPTSSELKLWRLIPRTLATHPEVWACSRFDGPCEVVAGSERRARFKAAGAFCLPVAPSEGPAICPWMDAEHVGAELIQQAVRSAPGIVSPAFGHTTAIAAAPESQ